MEVIKENSNSYLGSERVNITRVSWPDGGHTCIKLKHNCNRVIVSSMTL